MCVLVCVRMCVLCVFLFACISVCVRVLVCVCVCESVYLNESVGNCCCLLPQKNFCVCLIVQIEYVCL